MAITATPTGSTPAPRARPGSADPRSSSRRPRPPRGYRLRLAAGILGGGLIAWQALTLGLAQSALDGGEGTYAARLDPGSAEALAAAAEETRTGGDAPDAVAQAGRAVNANPTSAAAVRGLALAAIGNGDAVLGAKLMGQAATLGWRDTATQFWLAAAAHAAGDAGGAADHLDALARAADQPDARMRAFGAIDAVLAEPAMRDRIVAKLAVAPMWRNFYLYEVAGLPASALAARAGLFPLLARTPAPPLRREVQAFANEMIGRADYAGAHAIWARWLADPRLAGTPYDRGFGAVRPGTDMLPFEWTLRSRAGGGADPQDAGGGRGRLLHVHIEPGGSEPVLRQIVLLAPGAHGFAVRTGDAAADTRLRWTFTCEGQKAPLPAATVPIARQGAGAWLMRRRFAVPAGCPALEIALSGARADSSGAFDSWIDDARID